MKFTLTITLQHCIDLKIPFRSLEFSSIRWNGQQTKKIIIIISAEGATLSQRSGAHQIPCAPTHPPTKNFSRLNPNGVILGT